MGEVDLVPTSYRKRQLFGNWLKRALFSLFSITLMLLAAFVFLRFETASIDKEVKHLQTQKSISAKQRRELELLNARKSELTQQLDLLAGLRSGAAAEQMFLTVDKAMAGDGVWFTNWRFRRAGTPTDKDPKTVNTGYFIVIPKGKKSREEAWKIDTQMTIEGESMDYAALSTFVSNLITQPEIERVRVVSTEQVRVRQTKLVRFSLDVVVSSQGVKS